MNNTIIVKGEKGVLVNFKGSKYAAPMYMMRQYREIQHGTEAGEYVPFWAYTRHVTDGRMSSAVAHIGTDVRRATLTGIENTTREEYYCSSPMEVLKILEPDKLFSGSISENATEVL